MRNSVRFSVTVVAILSLMVVSVGCGDPSPTSANAGGVDAGLPAGGGATVDAGGGDDGGTDGDAGMIADAGMDAGPGDGGQPPTCAVTAPPGGTVVDYDEPVTFVASASDPEDGALTGASVVWTSNFVAGPIGTGLTITRQLQIAGLHTITCTATDSQGLTGSGPVDVTARSPVAVINHPGDGETRPSQQSIPFVGDARDAEDGVLPDGALVWTSSLDGMIGTGRNFSRTLSPGTNVVTLTVTDSDGNTGSQSVTLTITP